MVVYLIHLYFALNELMPPGPTSEDMFWLLVLYAEKQNRQNEIIKTQRIK